MPKLIAKKPFRYASRGLHAGEEFEANPRDARALVAVGRAEMAPAADLAEMEREALRAEAERLGIEVDGRWGAARLREAIAVGPPKPEEPPGPSVPRYSRRDMTAEDA